MKNNKNKIGMLVSLATIGIMTSCTSVNVPAGEEAVLVAHPLIFGHGGVFDSPVETGQEYAAFTTEYKCFPIYPLTVTEAFKDMIPSDNTPVSFNAYIKLQIIKGESPILYKDFGEQWYNNSIKEAFRTMVRNAASPYKMFELASDRKVSENIEHQLTIQLTTYVKANNIPVKIIQVIIGAIVPPDQVLTETKNTAAQNQSILTQNARASAELARKQAEINKAIADQAYQKQMNMTIGEYLQLRSLEIQKEKVELVKDHPNTTVILNEGSDVKPVVGVGK